MPNTSPTIENLNGDTVQYLEDGAVARLDANLNALVSDADSANFESGTLTVTYNRQTGDLLNFNGTATAGSGQTVVVGGVTIGTYAQISGGGLQFTFNAAATGANVQEVLRSLTFQTTTNTPVEGTRTFSFTLVDGDGTAGGGNDTATATSSVTVVATNDPPQSTDTSFQTDENTAINFASIDWHYSDVDGPTFGGIVIATLPSKGTILYHGVEVSAGQFIPWDDRQNATFQAAPEEGGFPYTSFTYQVRDSAGATDPTPNAATANVRIEYDAPYLANFGGTADPVQVTEDLGGFSIDPGLDAIVVDPDSPVLTNGSLRLLPVGTGLSYNFDINAGGGITVTGQNVGAEVQYNGVTFGTIYRDDHSWNITPGGFIVAFYGNATQEAVSALVHRVTVAIGYGNSGTYEFIAELKDGTSGSGTYNNVGSGGRNTPWYVTLTATNSAPVLSNLDELVVFTPSAATSGPQIIDADATLYDEENNFDGGTLTLSGALATDTLTIQPDEDIATSGSNVIFLGTVIGTFSGGAGGTELTITFNSQAYAGGIYAAIQRLAFQTSNAGDSTRELSLSVTDSGGAAASDTIIVQVGAGSQPSAGDDYLIGTSGNDHIDAQAGNDTLKGLAGDDVLIGGSGADIMDGGDGSDTFYVDNVGDVVIEAVAPGTDRVATSISYNLPGAADIEVFEAVNSTSTEALNLGGNNYGQTIVGNAGNNVINGGGGDDTLVGLAGDDTLIGSPGNDVMYGGTGNDVYFVDAAGDQVIENGGEGTDRVATSVSYILAAGSSIETLETASLSSTTGINLSGNTASQYVIGNSGSNTLNGGGGNDWLIGANGDDTLIGSSSAGTLEGGTGNDVYFVIDASDYIYERSDEGNDRVAVGTNYVLAASAEVETLETSNLAGVTGFSLTGNAFGQLIIGNAGSNVIDGKAGADTLVGGNGADYFTFTTSLGGSNIDMISDFVSGTDHIVLDDAVFGAIVPGALQAGAFVSGSQAADADDRIIYDSTTGALFYDPDGTGPSAMVQFATLDGHPPLNSGDLVLI